MVRRRLLLSAFLGVCGTSAYLYLLAPGHPALPSLTGFSDDYVAMNTRSRLATDLSAFLRALRGRAARWKPVMAVAIRDRKPAAKRAERKKAGRVAKAKKRKPKPKRVAEG